LAALKEIFAPFRMGALVLLLPVLLAGCALMPPGAGPDVVRERHPEAVELKDVPFFPQQAYQCGPAALATALGWGGESVTPAQLRPALYVPDKHGTLQVEMVGEARARGRLVYRLPPKIDSLINELEAGHPVIVLQNLGLGWWPVWHYAVVVGFDPVEPDIILRSGRHRRWVTPLPLFERTWARGDRWAIVVLDPGQIPASADAPGFLDAVLGLEAIGRWHAAGTAYGAAAARWPDNPYFRLGLANSLYRQGRLADAEKAYRDAIRLAPRNAAAPNNLALVLAEEGRWREALASARRAVTLGGSLSETARKTLETITCRQRGGVTCGH
jgi:hypothetical protein